MGFDRDLREQGRRATLTRPRPDPWIARHRSETAAMREEAGIASAASEWCPRRNQAAFDRRPPASGKMQWRRIGREVDAETRRRISGTIAEVGDALRTAEGMSLSDGHR